MLYILALLYSNITFYLTSIKLFYIRDIKVSSKGPKDDPKYYSKGNSKGDGEGDIGMIPLTILPIPLKRNRGKPVRTLI